ncbi:hypothetical protein [Sphingomonas immobilis]|uniref:Uncharacterized protein n=1 Tax=Sphingomonas immobilis TaxID=3063997 RepID=A0ABT8ZTH1_9SPHN|nr:hypothetical protein [Sphingomonas sp. CA1-15]MDO7840851.1 hypothetical protein [Sphingomonas sp. CA1-15]
MRGPLARVSPISLIAVVSGGAALDQILLWRFLGLTGNAVTALLAAALLAATAWLIVRAQRNAAAGVGLRTLAAATAIALLLCILGGEGRLLYATTDWQVRGAVLRDLTLYPWPFVYDEPGGPWLLRAPLGMYLTPALIGKAAGGVRAAEFALLAQNTATLACLFGLGALLFEGAKARIGALAIFAGFSGMDAIGQLLAGQPLTMNAERWNLAVYSAHLDQLYWVPQHALVGWGGAVLYLLWRAGKLPLAAALAPLPLLALWSPLALLGTLPFAAHAAIATLVRRDIRAIDLLLPTATALFALPGLLYLASGSDAVGGGLTPLPFHQYAAFEVLEVGPYLLGLWFLGRSTAFAGTTFAILAATLLLIPYGQVGTSTDFTMRASIPALAILALGVASVLLSPRQPGEGLWRGVLTVALAIGLVTPVMETWHAVSLPRAPRILCSYFGVVPGGFPTYVAPLARVSPTIAPRDPARIAPEHLAKCWDGPWPEPLLYMDQLH